MTRQPPGPPPGAGGGYRPELRYPPPPYPPGQRPLPPRRQPRGTPVIAPVLAFFGLVLVAAVSLWSISFLNTTLDDTSAGEATATPNEAAVALASEAPDGEEPEETPSTEDDPVGPSRPPTIAEPPPSERADVRGSILFTRGADIWAASGRELRRLTNSASGRYDSSPTWTSDGKRIYFIRTVKREVTGSKARGGGKYTLYPTDVMRMKANGRDKKRVFDSLSRAGGLWFTHAIQPDVSPDGRSIALVSDGPDGAGLVVLHILDARTGRLRQVRAPAGDFGHNDPAFSANGKRIAFTYNDNAGNDGRPRIAVHTCKTRSNCVDGKTRLLRPGYANPSWSPDGKWLAVEATTGTGRDIAIMNYPKGDIRVKLTNDGDSFAPEVSPDGQQIAYLHRDGTDIDLRVMTLEVDETGRITLVEDRPVTNDGGLDAHSSPSWFIPRGQRAEQAAPPEASPLEEGADGEPAAADEPEADVEPTSDGAPPPPPGA